MLFFAIKDGLTYFKNRDKKGVDFLIRRIREGKDEYE